jgi:hypothetical protein
MKIAIATGILLAKAQDTRVRATGDAQQGFVYLSGNGRLVLKDTALHGGRSPFPTPPANFSVAIRTPERQLCQSTVKA